MYLHCSVLYNLALTYENWGNISAAIENNEKSLRLMRKQVNGNQVTLSKGAVSNYKCLCIVAFV